jgi:hypothetical protein
MSNIFKSNNNNYKNEWNNKPNNFHNNNTYANREKKKVFLFNNESFPDLVSPKNQENVNIEKNNPLFTKMIHEQLEKEEEEKEKEKEQEKKEEKRWIVLKKGVPYQKQEEPKKEPKKEQVEPRKVFELLTKNYENWKKNYIDLWGHDDYEHHYRFPNHDYRYYETTSEYNSDLDLEDY